MPEPAQSSAKSARVHALPIDRGGRSSSGAGGHAPREPARAPVLKAAGTLGVVLILSACPATVDRPERVVTPDAIGIIEDIEASEDGTSKTLLLDTGEEVTIHNTRDLEAYGSNAHVGFLLVSGTVGDARWRMFIREDDDVALRSCYPIGAQPFDDGESVIFPAGAPDGDYGIRLLKAKGFEAEDPNPQTKRWGNFDGAFCLNEQGEVTGQAEALRRESD